MFGDARLREYAEARATQFLAEPFGQAPTVRIHGGPFLPQFLRGRYDDIEVTGSGLRLAELRDSTLDAHVFGAALPPRELLAGRAVTLPCDRVQAQVLIPYPELARLSRVPGLALEYRNGKVIASAALPVPTLGQLTRVSGVAGVELQDDRVALRVRKLTVAGLLLPIPVVNQLLPTLNTSFRLPELPFGLRVLRLDPRSGGVAVDAGAEQVVFTAAPEPVTVPH